MLVTRQLILVWNHLALQNWVGNTSVRCCGFFTRKHHKPQEGQFPCISMTEQGARGERSRMGTILTEGEEQLLLWPHKNAPLERQVTLLRVITKAKASGVISLKKKGETFHGAVYLRICYMMGNSTWIKFWSSSKLLVIKATRCTLTTALYLLALRLLIRIFLMWTTLELCWKKNHTLPFGLDFFCEMGK